MADTPYKVGIEMELTDRIYECWRRMGVCGNQGDMVGWLNAESDFRRIYELYPDRWLVGFLEGVGREEVANKEFLDSGTITNYEQGFNIGVEIRKRLIKDGLVVNLQLDERIQ